MLLFFWVRFQLCEAVKINRAFVCRDYLRYAALLARLSKHHWWSLSFRTFNEVSNFQHWDNVFVDGFYAKDTRSRKRCRFSERVSCKKRLRFSTPIRTCSISRSIFRSKWSIETVVIGLSSLFSFGLFVNSAGSVNKHFDYIFFLISVTIYSYMNA